MNFKDTPIQRKLMSVILLTCSVVLALMGSAYMIFEYVSFRATVKKNVSTLAIVIASNSSAAVAFDSQKDANETLNALRADKHIVAASLYDKNGNLFAKYPVDIPSAALPSKPQQIGYYFEGAFLIGFQPVMQEKGRLGTLYIKSDLEAIYAQMRINALIAIFLIAASLVVAYILSNLLQKSISQPILALEKTAKIISQKNDYSVRAIKAGNDEMGSLTDAFNQMLFQIQTQNLEIIKANEESLKLAAIVESSGDAIIGNSLELIITSWNNSAKRIFGYTSNEMIGQPVSQIISNDGQKDAEMALTRLKRGEQVGPFEAQFITKDKKVLDISLTISLVRNSSGEITGVSQIARDISVQKQNERLIIENEEHLRLATQAAELGTFDWDLTKGTIDWDARCRELFGVGESEKVTSQLFLNGLHEEDKDRIDKVIKTAFNKSLSDGNYDVEYRVISRDNKLHWIRAMGKVFFNEEDKPVRFIGTALEITDKKHEELKKNEFISIVSHELKTPLTSIKSYVQILLKKAKKESDEFIINALTRTEVQTNKMASMIQDFLSLARIEEGKIQVVKEVFDLYPLMQDIVAEALFITSTHTIKLKDCGTIKINADRDKIGQVLINLLSNAVKYSSPGSTVIIGCKEENGKVKVYVNDEGIGISSKDQKKLFSRFYRVENEKMKNVSGFGIGLYIVSEILKYHNSNIEVESTEGIGSTFYFYLEALI